jgi:cytochrome P450
MERGAEAEHLTELMSQLAHLAFSSWLAIVPELRVIPTRYGPLGKIRRHVEKTDRALFEEIARRRREPEGTREDILSLLLSARDESGAPLSDRELRDELIAALVGGHDTTGTAMAWLFERILSEPEVRAKVQAELDAVVGDGPLGRDAFGKLPYLDAVIKEALRARPIAPVGGLRVVMSDFEIAGYTLPPGTVVGSCAHLTFRRPDLYPEPERFLPERFLGKKVDPYEWAAFGGGVRRCLGMAFALYMMKVVAATVFSRARLRIEGPGAPGVRHGFFVAPKGGPRIVLEERRVAVARAA